MAAVHDSMAAICVPARRERMSDVFLKVNQIKKYFGGVKALDGVDLEIKKGEIHCLAGENGCGKSTIINVISGFYTPDAGDIIIEGKHFSKMTPKQSIAEGIQVIYQDLSLFPNLTVMENLALNMEVARGRMFVNPARMRRIAEEAIKKIDFEIDLDETVENLTVGTRQMIAIARALLNDAKLIIMDEPTTAITKKEVKSLFKVIKRLQQEGIAILFVSHKLDEVFEIAERFTVFRSGKNVASGDTKDLTHDMFTYHMTGRHLTAEKYVCELQDRKEVLSVQNLSLAHGFKDISFAVREGDILGITGLMGSGRTELAEAIFGYHTPDSGSIHIQGQEVVFHSIQDAIQAGIGYVPSDRVNEGLFVSQSIAENISLERWSDLSNAIGVIDERKILSLSEDWVQKLSIATKDVLNAISTLSGGNQQKCVLAKWLALDLKVLILNGPTVGVDIGAKFDIYEIVKELARKRVAVIMISDDLPEVLMNCNRVMVMKAGRIVCETDTADVDESTLAALAM